MTNTTDPTPAIEAWLAAHPEQAARPLPLTATVRLAAQTGLPRRAVEIALLERGLVLTRYARNLGTLGSAGQVALLRAHVAIVGAGGLGGWVAEGLCRLGVGRLRLIDGDVYEDSNLNRQLGCTETTLGQPKAPTLAERLRQVNGAVEVEPIVARLGAENAVALLEEANVVVDALDNIPSRLELERAARALGLPLVHGAIAGWTGQVMTILPGDAGLEAVYGAKPAHDHGVETRTGTPAATPMMVAAWMAQECAKLITGRGELIAGRLLLFDALYGEAQEVRVD
ncbi:MAG: HesA/MoeB/ThiF family protein [Anaerolineales bacterium]